MNESTITLQRHIRIAELAIEDYASRIAELERDLTHVRELLSVALGQLHAAHVRERRMTDRLRALAVSARAVAAQRRAA
jgi:hypothetical protein